MPPQERGRQFINVLLLQKFSKPNDNAIKRTYLCFAYLIDFVQSGYWTIENVPHISVIYIPTSGYFIQEHGFAFQKYHGYGQSTINTH